MRLSNTKDKVFMTADFRESASQNTRPEKSPMAVDSAHPAWKSGESGTALSIANPAEPTWKGMELKDISTTVDLAETDWPSMDQIQHMGKRL